MQLDIAIQINEGLYQQNKLATVSYQSSDSKEVQNNQKLYKLFNEQPIDRGRRGGFRGRRGFGFRAGGGFRPKGRPIRVNRSRGSIRGNRGSK